MQKQELAKQLTENHQSFVNYVLSLSEADFIKSENGKWTAGQQLDHLYRSAKPLVLAFSLPPFFVKLLFGKANRPSKTYEEIVQKYEGTLANGAKASGSFVPKTIAFEQRTTLANSLQQAVQKITSKVANYNEEQLDEVVLPHPLLGKMTAREMLYFTIYHVSLHQKITQRNLS
jgi:hypothetical protein